MIDIFSYQDFSFPEGFLLGSATSGHQIEGNNCHSNRWFSEIEANKSNPDYELSGMACNSYNMWREDVNLLSELGHNTYRMTAEWSRIEPEEGKFLMEEADHYIRILESLKAQGIRIVLSLVHGTFPYWFAQKGMNMETIRYFERYLNFIIPKFAPYVDYWCVFNEFNFSTNEVAHESKSMHIRFHARAYHIIKQYSNKPVSTAHAFRQHYAKRQNDPFDLAMQNYYDVIFNEFWFHAIRTGEIVLPKRDCFYDPEIRDTCDYWAVNTYAKTVVDARSHNCEYGERLAFQSLRLIEDKRYDMIQAFDPECFIQNFLRLKDKPVLITENGLCSDDDEFRIVWITEYLCALRECIDLGVDIIGYLYWSLLDNYEWNSYKPKFGLVDVDRENDFKRTIKPSGYYYRDIIKANGFQQKILEKYLTEMPKCRYKD